MSAGVRALFAPDSAYANRFSGAVRLSYDAGYHRTESAERVEGTAPQQAPGRSEEGKADSLKCKVRWPAGILRENLAACACVCHTQAVGLGVASPRYLW